MYLKISKLIQQQSQFLKHVELGIMWQFGIILPIFVHNNSNLNKT